MDRGDFGAAEQLRVQIRRGMLVYILKAPGSVSSTTNNTMNHFKKDHVANEAEPAQT